MKLSWITSFIIAWVVMLLSLPEHPHIHFSAAHAATQISVDETAEAEAQTALPLAQLGQSPSHGDSLPEDDSEDGEEPLQEVECSDSQACLAEHPLFILPMRGQASLLRGNFTPQLVIQNLIRPPESLRA